MTLASTIYLHNRIYLRANKTTQIKSVTEQLFQQQSPLPRSTSFESCDHWCRVYLSERQSSVVSTSWNDMSAMWVGAHDVCHTWQRTKRTMKDRASACSFTSACLSARLLVFVCVCARTPGAYVREGEGGSRTGGELVVVVGILEMIFNVGKR